MTVTGAEVADKAIMGIPGQLAGSVDWIEWIEWMECRLVRCRCVFSRTYYRKVLQEAQ